MITPPGRTTLAALALGVLLAACANEARVPTAPGGRGAVAAACAPDLTAPALGAASASPNVLWPPNHKMVAVSVAYSVSDACDAAPRCALTVASNEPVNGIGDGNTAPDWIVTSSRSVQLRAERAGPLSGRVYTITVTCTDASGNRAFTTTTVTVPHDQGKRA